MPFFFSQLLTSCLILLYKVTPAFTFSPMCVLEVLDYRLSGIIPFPKSKHLVVSSPGVAVSKVPLAESQCCFLESIFWLMNVGDLAHASRHPTCTSWMCSLLDFVVNYVIMCDSSAGLGRPVCCWSGGEPQELCERPWSLSPWLCVCTWPHFPLRDGHPSQPGNDPGSPTALVFG